MKRNRLRFPAKIIPFLIIFIVLLFLIGYILKIVNSWDYFRVKDIILRDAGNFDLSYFKGRNIFSIDLKRESRRILEYYPNSSAIRLVRLLPDRLFVDIIERKPVALVKLYRYFALDKEGVLFDLKGIAQQDPQLPVISGLETKIFGPKAGAKYNLKEISFALQIIKEISSQRPLKNYKITRIDVANPGYASLYIPVQIHRGVNPAAFEPVEIKIANNDVKERIALLAGMLASGKLDFTAIKYIDFRFKDPVIKMKERR